MLTIQVASCKGNPPSSPQVAVIDEQGGTVGTAADSTLVLAADHAISPVHLRVTAAGEHYLLENVGDGLSVIQNGQEIEPGIGTVLGHADRLELGPYVLLVALISKKDKAGSASTAPKIESTKLETDPVVTSAGDYPVRGAASPLPAATASEQVVATTKSTVPTPSTEAAASDKTQGVSTNAVTAASSHAPAVAAVPLAAGTAAVSRVALKTASAGTNVSASANGNAVLSPVPTSNKPQVNAPLSLATSNKTAANDAAVMPLKGAAKSTHATAMQPVSPAPVSNNFSAGQTRFVIGEHDQNLLAPAPAAPPPVVLIPDDFDPFAELSPPPQNPTLPMMAAGAGGLAEFDLGAGLNIPPKTLDEMFGLSSSGVLDPGATLYGPDHPLGDPISEPNTASDLDPLLALSHGHSKPAFKGGVQRDDAAGWNAALPLTTLKTATKESPLSSLGLNTAPSIGDPFGRDLTGHLIKPPSARSNASASETRYSSKDGAQAELLKAFLVGAGASHVQGPNALTAETMYALGALLKIAVDGAQKLSQAQQATGQKSSAEAAAADLLMPNPIKTSSSPEKAIEYLLAPPSPGSMSPMQAFRDVFDSLLSHQASASTEKRAALAEVFKQLNPNELQRRLGPNTFFDDLSATRRKAKLWDLFIAMYEDVYEEASARLASGRKSRRKSTSK